MNIEVNLLTYRRMKAEVLQQLPRKYRTMVVLDPHLISHNKSMKDSHSAVEKSKVFSRLITK